MKPLTIVSKIAFLVAASAALPSLPSALAQGASVDFGLEKGGAADGAGTLDATARAERRRAIQQLRGEAWRLRFGGVSAADHALYVREFGAEFSEGGRSVAVPPDSNVLIDRWHDNEDSTAFSRRVEDFRRANDAARSSRERLKRWLCIQAVPRLARAIEENDVELTRVFLRHAPRLRWRDLRVEHPLADVSKGARGAMTLLALAAGLNRSEILALLLQRPDVDADALNAASVELGTGESVAGLMLSGDMSFLPSIDSNHPKRRARGHASLAAAVLGCREGAARVLLTHPEIELQIGTNSDFGDEFSLLGIAAQQGCSESLIDALWKRGIHPRKRDCQQFSQRIPACFDERGQRRRIPGVDLEKRRARRANGFVAVLAYVVGGPAGVLAGLVGGAIPVQREVDSR